MTSGGPRLSRARGARFCCALAFGFGVLHGNAAVAQTTLAQPANSQQKPGAESRIVAFDMPSQPLATALEAFGAMTQLELFYESSLVVGRRASAVHGELAPEAALAMLLRGTGLSAASFERGTITVMAPSKATSVAELAQIKSRTREFSPYLAKVQGSLDAAFCNTTAASKDQVEVVARLWIAPSGGVSRAELVSSTGSDERDRGTAAALRSLAIAPPPSAMPQPITVMILPRQSGQSAGCPGRQSVSSPHE